MGEKKKIILSHTAQEHAFNELKKYRNHIGENRARGMFSGIGVQRDAAGGLSAKSRSLYNYILSTIWICKVAD